MFRGWLVDPLRHPDLNAFHCPREGILQVGQGVVPRSAIVVPGSILVHIDQVGRRFVGPHVDDGRVAAAGVGYGGNVDAAGVVAQVGGDAGQAWSVVVPGIDGRRGELQAQVSARCIDKERVRYDVARTALVPRDSVAAALDVTVGDHGRTDPGGGIGVVHLIRGVSP